MENMPPEAAARDDKPEHPRFGDSDAAMNVWFMTMTRLTYENTLKAGDKD